jgi:hypothetical protein
MTSFNFDNSTNTYQDGRDKYDLTTLTVKLGLSCFEEYEQRQYALKHRQSYVFGDSKSITVLIFTDNQLTKKVIKNPNQSLQQNQETTYPNWEEYASKLLRLGFVIHNPKYNSVI